MPLILAIEPDRRQSARVAALAKNFLDADIVVVHSVDAALEKLKSARPALVLTPLLLSTRDDSALTRRLRELAEDGLELQTLVIPVLAAGEDEPGDDERSGGGLLNRLRRPKSSPAVPSGCEPEVFAAQITEYLERLAADRHDREHTQRRDAWVAQTAASAPMLGELLTMPGGQMLRPATPISDIAPHSAFTHTPVDPTPDIREALFSRQPEEKIEHPSAQESVDEPSWPGEPIVRPALTSFSSLADAEPAAAPRVEEPLWFNEPIVRPQPTAFSVPASEPEPAPAAARVDEPLWFNEPIVRPQPTAFSVPASEPEPAPAAAHVDEPLWFNEPVVRPQPTAFSVPVSDPEPAPAAARVDEPLWFNEPIVHPQPTPFSVPASEPEPAPAAARVDEPLWFNEPIVRPQPTRLSAPVSDPEPAPARVDEPLWFNEPVVRPQPTAFSVPASEPEPAPAAARVNEPAWSNEPIVRPEPRFSSVPPIDPIVHPALTSFSVPTFHPDPAPAVAHVAEPVWVNEPIAFPEPTSVSEVTADSEEAPATSALSDLVADEFSADAGEATEPEPSREEPVVPLPSAEPDQEAWEDLESILEEFEIETADAEIAAPVVVAKEEPRILEVPAADELWEALESAREPVVAPDEGPQLKKRRAPTPKRPPKAARTATAKVAKAKPPRSKTKKQQRPMQDEWGLYDPEQCGFAALLERLEELTDSEAREK